MRVHKPRITRIARTAGGLFLGLLFHFPANMMEMKEGYDESYQMATLEIGLIFWRLTFDLSWRHVRL